MNEIERDTSFGRWLSKQRKELDLTQFDLAERVGCSEDTIQKIERGERRPSKQIAQRLAECLEIPPGEQQAFVVAAREGSFPTSPDRMSDSSGQQASADQAIPTNLPTPLSPIIGREELVADARNYLRDGVRLLTLTGAPGIGKTRLSLQVASELLPAFQGGIFMVELAPISNPDLVPSTIAGALEVGEVGTQSILDALKQYIKGKEHGGRRILLLLDNFEQVLDAAPVVVDLLGACPQLKAMVTSREALHVSGEQQMPVPPLRTPDVTRLPDAEALADYPALQLFVQRAGAADPTFRLNAENAREVAVICARLEGLPLAIELAAARIKFFSPQALLSRLESRLKVLTGGARALPQRQQTLRGAIEWSFDLLTNEEKVLFRRLAVFVGGCTIEAAEAVCNAGEDLGIDMVDGLISLVEKSLLRREEGTGDEPRFVMLETILEYASEKLQQSGEVEELQREHALYFMRLSEAAGQHLRTAKQQEWLDRLEHEIDNIRAVLRWAEVSRDADAVDFGLRTGGALLWFWHTRAYIGEALTSLNTLLGLQQRTRAELSAPVEDSQFNYARESKKHRAKALNAAGYLTFTQGRRAEAHTLYEESLTISRELGDRAGMAASLNHLGHAHLQKGTGGRLWLEESLVLYRELGDKAGMAYALNNLGTVAGLGMEYPLARSLYEQSLALRREIGDAQGIGSSLNNLGVLAHQQEDYDRARTMYEESLFVARQVGDKSGIAFALGNLGNIAHLQGDYADARTMNIEAVVLARELGDTLGVITWTAAVGVVDVSMGETVRGTKILAAMEAQLEQAEWSLEKEDRIPYERAVVIARGQLGEDEFKQVWQQGRAMSMEEAVGYALQAH